MRNITDRSCAEILNNSCFAHKLANLQGKSCPYCTKEDGFLKGLCNSYEEFAKTLRYNVSLSEIFNFVMCEFDNVFHEEIYSGLCLKYDTNNTGEVDICFLSTSPKFNRVFLKELNNIVYALYQYSFTKFSKCRRRG
ncbi:MAG: hypothetical protein VKL60_15240 [Sphaerospermopsis sp.]|nr:hypothetical protein [Sphaerospermopsis sp.]